MRDFYSSVRHLSIIYSSLFIAVFTACAAPTTLPPRSPVPQETPTLLGTNNPSTQTVPTALPKPASCFFRTNPTDEIGVYRFNWQNATITLNTKIGNLIVDGPRDLTPGPRQLVLLHNTQLTAQASVIVNFDPGGTLIDDPLNGVQEVRDAGGTVVIQNMTDPQGDTKGMPAYLDIVRVERTFGYYPNSVVRVYLAGIHTGQYIWSSQNVSVAVAGQTYTQTNFSDGRIALTQTDTVGRVTDWAGPVTVTGNVFAFALQVGVDQPVSAATITSSGGGDTTALYPVEAMNQVWQAVKQHCG